jgi:hypothetical protein
LYSKSLNIPPFRGAGGQNARDMLVSFGGQGGNPREIKIIIPVKEDNICNNILTAFFI